MTSQNQQLISLLKKRWVTPLMALERTSCMRLAARISDIKAAGYSVEDKWITGKTTKRRFKAYRIVGEPEARKSA